MERSGGPAAVIRQSTVDLARLLDKSKNGSSKESRHVLGELSGYRSSEREAEDQLVRLVVGKARYCFKAQRMPVRAVGSYSTSQEVSPISALFEFVKEKKANEQHLNGSNRNLNTDTTHPQNHSLNQL